MFSRRYTLQLHERTHLHAQDYYFWKKAPRIGLGNKASRIVARTGGSLPHHRWPLMARLMPVEDFGCPIKPDLAYSEAVTVV